MFITGELFYVNGDKFTYVTLILTDTIPIHDNVTDRGMWVDDKACGIGTLEYSSGDIYEGSWENDQRHGM